MTIRALYIEQVQSTANLEAAIAALDLQLAENRRVVARWTARAGLPLSVELRGQARGIASRYAAYVDSALVVRKDCARALGACRRAEESMLAHLTRLGGMAARAGIDTRPLAVEIDLGVVERTAAERSARALIAEGICETDEERVFLEKLFERGLESRPV